MNVAVVHAKMEEYVLMESMLTFASVSVVSLERIAKWTSMIAIQHLVKMEELVMILSMISVVTAHLASKVQLVKQILMTAYPRHATIMQHVLT